MATKTLSDFQKFQNSSCIRLGSKISENSQKARWLFWKGHFLLAPNKFEWCTIWLRIILRNLKLICIHMRRVSYAQIVHYVIFCVIVFSTLCDTYAIHRQYTGLPKNVTYTHVYCIQLLDIVFKIILTSWNSFNVKKC